jgi:hypothetical protein
MQNAAGVSYTALWPEPPQASAKVPSSIVEVVLVHQSAVRRAAAVEQQQVGLSWRNACTHEQGLPSRDVVPSGWACSCGCHRLCCWASIGILPGPAACLFSERLEDPLAVRSHVTLSLRG